jgi:hypothetical protein
LLTHWRSSMYIKSTIVCGVVRQKFGDVSEKHTGSIPTVEKPRNQ